MDPELISIVREKFEKEWMKAGLYNPGHNLVEFFIRRIKFLDYYKANKDKSKQPTQEDLYKIQLCNHYKAQLLSDIKNDKILLVQDRTKLLSHLGLN